MTLRTALALFVLAGMSLPAPLTLSQARNTA